MFLKNLISIGRQASQRVAIVGGSNSVMRRGYAKYLNEELSKTTSQSTLLKYYSLGGVPSIFSLIQQYRHNIALKSNLIFFEYCINDRHAIKIGHYSLELAGKSLEGFIRSCQRANPNCLIVILIFGINLDTYYH
ncbi:MAG: SGNH/GDSL hydrolase family protein, partial [Cyanobacteria bacterium P01_E01_bin.35]